MTLVASIQLKLVEVYKVAFSLLIFLLFFSHSFPQILLNLHPCCSLECQEIHGCPEGCDGHQAL